tara:strand:+ start:373 stop:873 length:501 start_codon:yes stop_codon:yes gene_type:complete
MQTIKTNLISTPTVSVPNSFTALHLAHISWNLFSANSPTHYSNEFSIDDSSDFAHYNIQDSMDIAQHFYDCAFAIGSNVESNVDYSIQDAFNMLDDFYGDTSVREDVSTQIEDAIQQLVTDSNYAKYTDYIAQDYTALVEDTQQALPTQIAQLEKQLAQLKAKQSA